MSDVPAYIDLVEWIKMRSRMSTSRAVGVIMSGALMVDSHPIGFKHLRGGRKILERCVPAELRGRIDIVDPEALNVRA